MAKRKRLTPAQSDYLEAPAPLGLETKSMPLRPPSPAPIAQVAGHASTTAALEELTSQMTAARREGRFIETLPLDVIDEGYLVRDRIEQDADELTALMDSLRARGQQTAIEVIALPDTTPTRYGLISGWRRLTALKRLYEATSDSEFAHVKAIVIAPKTAQAAYVAMVEENEIRVNLSLYERARIALRTVEEGVYPTSRAALQGLYGAVTRSKRSKIGSFMQIVEALDGALRFPTSIPERLGLSLVKALGSDPEFAQRARVRLETANLETAEAELRLLSDVISTPTGSAPEPQVLEPVGQTLDRPASSNTETVRGAVQVHYDKAAGRVELSGEGVDPGFVAALEVWLRQS